MPESRSRSSSSVYGRNVGEAISAPSGGVKRMLTVSVSSARIFSLIAGNKTRQTRGSVDQVAVQIILQNYL
jgi:RNase H-fold protein (predicted Holliday junction resolvase)